MADANITTNGKNYNSLIGAETVDTLCNCSQVLSFLQMAETEGEPTESEKRGLSLIHNLVKKALDFEIDRVG